MDRVAAPEIPSAEIPWPNSERFDGSNDVEAVSGSIHQLERSRELAPGTATASPTLIGRPDIDTAVLDALRHASGSDHGFPGPGWVSPDRDGRGVVCQSAGQGDSTSGSALSRRSDIESAMLDALRRAIVSDPESPVA